MSSHVMSMGRPPCLEDEASFWARQCFSFHTPVMALGYKQPLVEDDLPDLPRDRKARSIHAKYVAAWEAERRDAAHPSILRMLAGLHIGSVYLTAFLELLEVAVVLTVPLLLKAFIEGIRSPAVAEEAENSSSSLTGWVCLLFVLLLLKAFVSSAKEHRSAQVGMDMSSGLCGLLCYKLLKVSAGADYDMGEVLNILTMDIKRLQDCPSWIHVTWSGPLQVVVTFCLLYWQVGKAGLSIMPVVPLCVLLQRALLRRLKSTRREALKLSDQRLSLTREMLCGMRVVKLCCLEEQFAWRIKELRVQERQALAAQARIKSLTTTMFQTLPVVMAVPVIVNIWLTLGQLQPAIVFPCLALLAALKSPLSSLASLAVTGLEVSIAVDRFTRFLMLPEKEPPAIRLDHERRYQNTCIVKDASFAWGKEVALNHVNLVLKPASRTVIVGPIGSGKSSLLLALLGEMTKTHGDIYVPGRISYMPQRPWIVQDTIRFNITFDDTAGKPACTLEQALQACALNVDLDRCCGRENAQIGEAGATVSGGQQNRISLARAVYRNADIYLLDDPLSGVDPEVQQHLWSDCVNGVLKGKTVVLCTHQTNFLHRADQAIVMDHGRIAWQGDPRDFQDIPHADMSPSTATIDEDDDKKDKSLDKFLEKANPTMTAEERPKGPINRHVYSAYRKALGNLQFAFCMAAVSAELCRLGANLALRSGSSCDGNCSAVLLGIYAVLGAFSAVCTSARVFVLATAAQNAAEELHTQMFDRIQKAPMSFFHATPVGQILNRFGKDMESIDVDLAWNANSLVSGACQAAGTLLLTGILVPWAWLGFASLLPLYYALLEYYRCSSRELQRIVSIRVSPLLAHFHEVMAGIRTIRNNGLDDLFNGRTAERLDRLHRARWCASVSNRWLSLRLDILGALLIVVVAMFCSVTSTSPSAVGLAVVCTLQATSFFRLAIKAFTALEVQMTSVERILHYATKLPSEASPGSEARQPGHYWVEGPASVVFRSVSVRHRPGLPLALRGISANIEAGEKIGIVGRTGSGKSTLVAALSRMVDFEAGQVLIDGVDSATVSLQELRSVICVISQGPMLFSGTIRDNLDPRHERSEERIFEVLTAVRLADLVRLSPGRLDAPVHPGGTNFSAGQRQLFCLARAALADCRVVVLDECTANVDPTTTQYIYDAVRELFQQHTVFNIAHQLETVVGMDRVMVLDEGRLVEFDTPRNLLKARGHFARMVSQTCEADILHSMAHQTR